MIRPIALAATLLLIGSGCGAGDDEPGNDQTPAVMAAALAQLAGVDHTFGNGPPPFTRYLLLDHLDPQAGDGSAAGPSRPLTDAEMQAIAKRIEGFAPVQWISDSSGFITEQLTPTIDGAAILGVGQPQITGSEALVPVSLWCGGTCGAWHTYRLELVDGVWTVTGFEGPRTIS